jgi:hypothetical protein
VDVLDVFEAEFLELRDGLAAAETTGAIDEHRLFLVEAATLVSKASSPMEMFTAFGSAPPSNSPVERTSSTCVSGCSRSQALA